MQIHKICVFESANYILTFRTCIHNQIEVNTLRFREIPWKFWMSRTLNYYDQIHRISPLLNQRLGKPLNCWKIRKQRVLIKFETKCQLKSGINHLSAPLVKLFNFIISKGTFPDSWSTGMITPIFKSGNRSDPSNYRGILCYKLFRKIILLYPEYKIKRIFSQSDYFTLFPDWFSTRIPNTEIISLFWWELLLINMLKMKTEVNYSVFWTTSYPKTVWVGMAWWFTVKINTQQKRLALFWPSLRCVLKIKVCHPIWW